MTGIAPRPGRSFLAAVFLVILTQGFASGQTNPLWTESKVKNYLPHMTWPEVEDADEKGAVMLVPLGVIEQHGPHLPLGTDIYAATKMCSLMKSELGKQGILSVTAPLCGLASNRICLSGKSDLSRSITFTTGSPISLTTKTISHGPAYVCRQKLKKFSYSPFSKPQTGFMMETKGSPSLPALNVFK